jgi:hypothetical protein
MPSFLILRSKNVNDPCHNRPKRRGSALALPNLPWAGSWCIFGCMDNTYRAQADMLAYRMKK